ncbi:MAG: hypothetical protein FWH14_05275 [Oscillospiraceae bacterium]|nr:hypothetical protein [Oscillospiraceae bacterium]
MWQPQTLCVSLALPLGELSAATPTERAVGMTALGHPLLLRRRVFSLFVIFVYFVVADFCLSLLQKMY